MKAPAAGILVGSRTLEQRTGQLAEGREAQITAGVSATSFLAITY